MMIDISKRRILVIGIYLLNEKNYAVEITQEINNSKDWSVDIHWASIGTGVPPVELDELTFLKTEIKVPKFELLNKLLQNINLSDYRFLLVTDDDICMEEGFVDEYLRIVDKYNFSLAQPARSHDSYMDHYFVSKLEGVEARQTRFVEIGPLFSIRKDAYDLLLPFDEEAYMGWGLDSVWPYLIERAGLCMGISDVTPVLHSLRKPVSLYEYNSTKSEMEKFLAKRAHLPLEEAFQIIVSYSGLEQKVRKGD